MAYNTQAILRDVNRNPIPQVFDAAGDAYQPWKGTASGHGGVVLYGADGNPVISNATADSDGQAAPTVGKIHTLPMLYNGATYDRQRGVEERTLLQSAARTASPADTEFTNYCAKGIILVIDVTAITDTPSIVATLKGKDPLSGKTWNILASAAITAVGTTVLRVHPNLTAAANLVANDVLPRSLVLSVAHADADPITYSVGAVLVP